MPVTTIENTENNAGKPSQGKPNGMLRARPPAWLKMNELNDANLEADSTVADLSSLSAAELRTVTKRRLREEIAFISNDDFTRTDMGKKVFSEQLDLAPRQAELGIAAIRRSGIDMPIHLGRLCEAPLLKPEQERTLFRRMNFLLQQAAIHRSLLNPARPSRVRLD